uniref:Uncharacterized protein n=1 Tax=Laticauda laticaudata TaxID=8630 RepID=A0A8C5RWY7_LATLA
KNIAFSQSNNFPFLDDGRLAPSVERAEIGQGDHQQTLNANWSSPEHSSRSQSLRSSPIAYKKTQPAGELQRRSSTSLDNRRKDPLSGHDPRTAVQLRSLSTVLKRLKEIMEGKSQVI